VDLERAVRKAFAAVGFQRIPGRRIKPRHVVTGRPDPERVRVPPLSKDSYGTVTVSFPGSTPSSPAAPNSSTRCPALVPARPDSSSAVGSRSRTADQNVVSGPLPLAKSQTQAATTPPGRVTRAISASPATGSAMKCTTSWASAASTLPSASREPSAAAWCITTPGIGAAPPHERGGRVGRDHPRGAQPLDQPYRQRPRPAADIQRPPPGPDSGPLHEQVRERLRIPAHERRVRIRPHVEGHAGTIEAHARR
jgi:hypothetical protein